MFVFSILAVVLIAIDLLGTKWVLSDYMIPIILGAIIAGFVCSFIEIGRGTELAYERIRKKV
jgi:vacuolar-type H+-ATPase subunit I/STV1